MGNDPREYVLSLPPIFDGGSETDRAGLVEFYNRLRVANDRLDPVLLREIWSADPGGVFFNTNGHTYYGLEDWLKIWSHYGPRLKRGQPAGTGQLRILVRDDIAVIIDDRCGRTLQWPDGVKPPPFVTPYFRATVVCRREGGRWKGLHVHYSSGQMGPRPEAVGWQA
jgi:hypothetical protein